MNGQEWPGDVCGSERRSKNRALSDSNQGDRNGREVGGTLWHSGDNCWSYTKVCAALAAQVDLRPSFPRSQGSQRAFTPPSGMPRRRGVGPFLPWP